MSTISQTNKKSRKKLKITSKLIMKILVYILVFSMLAGTFYYALSVFEVHSHAQSVTDDDYVDTTMRIAIFYDDKLEPDVRLLSETGFEVGYTNGGREAVMITTLDYKALNVARHCNLKHNGTRYVKASSNDNTTIGSYHIQIKSSENYKSDIDALKKLLPDYNVFVAVFDDQYYVMVGQFVSKDKANEALTTVKSKAASLNGTLKDAVNGCTVHTPQNSTMIVIDPSTHNIVWAYNVSTGSKLFAIGPVKSSDGSSYMHCYHGSTVRYYDGYFECSSKNPSGYFGVCVVNLVKLENYIAGVTTAEISTYWPIETLKAFSVAVRSYSLKSFNTHSSSYNADLCNTAHCQVFNGYHSTTDRVWRAVKETRGIIAVSNGNICGTYYSSSTGGCTANCTDVWGSSLSTYPYLKAVATPWEKYETYNRGYKTYTVSATALTTRINQMATELGYSKLNSDVTKIEITKTGQNTTYVTEIKFYDKNGNTVTVKRADKIKKLLSPYVDSSNFIVGKSGSTLTRTDFTMLGFGGVNDSASAGLDILANPNRYTVFGRRLFNVITSGGIKDFNDSESEKVMTANGIKDFNMTKPLDAQSFPTISGINGEILPNIEKISPIVTTTEVSTVYVANSFTFVSRGWGHGVGMSQYGIYELGNLGYDYKTILRAYYTGIEYVSYADYIGNK